MALGALVGTPLGTYALTQARSADERAWIISVFVLALADASGLGAGRISRQGPLADCGGKSVGVFRIFAAGSHRPADRRS